MHLDNQAIFSDQQEVQDAGDNISTNVLDLGQMGLVAYNAQGGPRAALKRRLGVGMIVPLLIQVVESYAGDITTLTLELQESSDEAFTAPNNVISLEVPVADLVAGYIFPIDKFPREIRERYIRLNYDLDQAATAGKITAGVTTAVDGGHKGI
jgi:hypothetical protein